MQRSVNNTYATHFKRVVFCLLVPIGTSTSLVCAMGINQQVDGIQSDINAMIISSNATMTTANAIYPEVQATLTTLNAITFDPTNMIATLTTLNSIKIDTTATLTTHEAILTEVITTQAETNSIYTDLQATLTTLNSASIDTNATATTAQAMYSQINPLPDSLKTILTEAHATHTTADAIKIETTITNTNNLAMIALLNTINSTETNIKNDTSTVVALYPPIQVEAIDTNTTTSAINVRTSTLATPFYGGTISSPGAYRLAQNVTGPITITSSNVCLMLNGYTVTGVGTPGLSILISGLNLSNIYIAGGTLKGSGMSGSQIVASTGLGTQNLIMEHLMITDSETGIVLSQSRQATFRDINFRNVVNPISGTQELNTRIKRCLMQFDAVAGTFDQNKLIGINLTSLSPALSTGGFFIQNCTIKGYRVGISITDAFSSTIDNCTIGDIDLPWFAGLGLTREVDGIIINSCTASVISNCTLSSIGIQPNGTIEDAFAYGIKCTSADVLVSNCILGNIYTSNTDIGNRTYGIFRDTVSPDQSNTINCLIDNLDGYRVFGVYVGSTSSQVNVNKTVVSNLDSTNAGAAFFKDPAATSCDFTQNVAINMSGTAVAFSGISNVISGFNGSRTVFNYSLPS